MTGEGMVLRKTIPGYCVVRVMRDSACGQSCLHCQACGGAPPIDITARNSINAAVGQKVVFESDTAATLKLAAIVYLIPIVLCLIGSLFHPLWGAILLLAGVGFAFYTNRRLQKNGSPSVTIVETVDN